MRIADDVIGYPMTTASLAASLHGVSYQAANIAIAKLVDRGTLRQRSLAATIESSNVTVC